MKPEPLNISPKATGSTSEALNPTITFGTEDVINAMEVVGFQDQGRDKVIEIIKDKFQELLQGNTDVIPSELYELTGQIMEVVQQLASTFT
ncbi:hypothetical protein [Colwellia sp. MB02u-14]|jgi:hypothetical protein|uniref:hypothetical protein n=1 Tax=Colwellia sp. MB02u-14 TaxID=2759815 RepID=UPI0015F4F06A|nr:hypothetical protein [Colwellia sp. MB02u-14]MBA6302352.1 hypothetical protein [Colwellia sp. MB02u-14]